MGDLIDDTILLLSDHLRAAVNASCSCGGRGPEDDCCPACEVWHRIMQAAQAERGEKMKMLTRAWTKGGEDG